MKCLLRNKRKFYYCTYQGKTAITDDYGNYTGEYKLTYSTATSVWGNISPAQGEIQVEQFGNALEYDKVIVLDNPTTPIDENTVLFIDKEPEYSDGVPLYDYFVRKVARSLNSVSIAISKVDVS